jgi:hypothetical protein
MLENESTVGEMLTSQAPGISWTAPPKSRPWLNPPAQVKVTTVAKSYMMALGQAEAANDILDALETGVPIATIAESFMLAHVSEGRHTLDAGILVMPVIMELLKSIADFNDIKVVMFQKDLETGTTIPPRLMREFVNKMNAPIDEPVLDEALPEEPAGLMARKQKEVM